MNIKHHPDESTLFAYAAGTLDEAFALVVSCHLEVCPSCREAVKVAEQVGGASLDLCKETAVDNGSFGRLLEKISAEKSALKKSSPEEAAPQHVHKKLGWPELPATLEQYLDAPLSEVKWKRAGPGVWQKPIKLSDGANSSLRLLRISPDRKVPEHGHGGQEMTLILRGCYQDEIGVFGAGDVADLDEDVEHQPHVVSGEDCICLAATEAATRFKGIAGRLLQPIVGI